MSTTERHRKRPWLCRKLLERTCCSFFEDHRFSSFPEIADSRQENRATHPWLRINWASPECPRPHLLRPVHPCLNAQFALRDTLVNNPCLQPWKIASLPLTSVLTPFVIICHKKSHDATRNPPRAGRMLKYSKVWTEEQRGDVT